MIKNFKVPYSKIILILWALILIGLLTAYIFMNSVSTNFAGWYGEMPPLSELENPENEVASELYSDDGVLLGKYYRENRSNIKFKDLSPNLINALIATEDIRFEDHAGIDHISLFRVAFKSLLLGDRSGGGGSTITQQLAKNLFQLRRDSTYIGSWYSNSILKMLAIKSKEWIMAAKIEKNYTKKEIIALYLNTVDFGSNSFGIKVASKTFFNTSPDSLKVEEAAVLVGLLKAPSRYSPVYNPQDSKKRRNVVLGQMHKYKIEGKRLLTESIKDSIQNLPLSLDYNIENHNTGIATYFRSELVKYLNNWCEERGYDLWGDGLKIYVTIDTRLQKYAEEAVEEHMSTLQKKFFKHWKGKDPWIDENNKPIPNYIRSALYRSDFYREMMYNYDYDSVKVEKALTKPIEMTLFSWQGEIDTVISPLKAFEYHKKYLHTGFLSMDPYTGHIKAWVGGINHKFFKYDHVKQGKNQPGSTFKPFVYGAYLREGLRSPCEKFVDAPVSFKVDDPENPTWVPQNFEKKYTYDQMTIRQALAQSKNSITAQIMKKITPQKVVEFAKDLGIKSDLNAVPALSLGTSDVSLFEMVGAYSVFINEGTYTEPYYLKRIEDKNGNTIFEFPESKKEVISEDLAYLMLYMLRGATEERNGTALGLYRWGVRDYNQIAAKTGTTSNYSDGWFMGITRDLVSGVWVGGDERVIHFRTGNLGQGARTAMPIWGLYQQKIYADSTLNYERGRLPSKPLSVTLDCSKFEAISTDTTFQNNIQNPVEEESLDNLF